MKTVSVPTDWLNEINGRTVAHAVAYLSTLPSDHELNYWQNVGDDRGVEIRSELLCHRPYTEQELAELAAWSPRAREIMDCKASIAYFDNQAAFWADHDNCLADSYRRNAELCRQRLKELT